MGAPSLGTSALNLSPRVDVVTESGAHTLFMGKKQNINCKYVNWGDQGEVTHQPCVDEMFSQVVPRPTAELEMWTSAAT